jgi:hypothetical protein
MNKAWISMQTLHKSECRTISNGDVAVSCAVANNNNRWTEEMLPLGDEAFNRAAGAAGPGCLGVMV